MSTTQEDRWTLTARPNADFPHAAWLTWSGESGAAHALFGDRTDAEAYFDHPGMMPTLARLYLVWLADQDTGGRLSDGRALWEVIRDAFEAEEGLMVRESVQPCGPEMVVHHYPHVVAKVAVRAIMQIGAHGSAYETFVQAVRGVHENATPFSYESTMETLADALADLDRVTREIDPPGVTP